VTSTNGQRPLPLQHVLVLTATIDPKSMSNTQRNDPAVRLNDYRVALKAWLECGAFNRIIFCENSGYDLTSIRQICDRCRRPGTEVELLSFTQESFPEKFGKGYGEMLILAHVLRESALLQPAARMVKVTGRLFVRNARQLAAGFAANADAAMLCALARNLTYTDCRVFAAGCEFLEKYLLPMATVLDESAGINFERVLARAVHLAMASGLKWAQLPVVPDLVGFSGTQNKEYRVPRLQWLAAEMIRRIRGQVLAR